MVHYSDFEQKSFIQMFWLFGSFVYILQFSKKIKQSWKIAKNDVR
jgi:hypothetical protein